MGCNVFHIKIIIFNIKLLTFNIKMADEFDRVFDESSWQKAFSSVEDQFDSLYSNPRATSVVVVISPLKALMRDQVNYLQNLCIPAVAIVDELCSDPEIIQQVKNGTFTHVYGSPECFLASETWREIFCDADFTSKLVGVAVDEAHCIVQW